MSELVSSNQRTQSRRNGATRVLSFTSGKGGVGKTNIVINTAITLARMGRRVLILDADLGLANIDVLLGIVAEATIHDVLEGRAHLREITVPGPDGISIIPAASGVEKISDLSTPARLLLMQQVEEVAQEYDYLLIDTRAGISPDVMYFNSAASEVICVISDEPTSLADAYAVIKVLAQNYGERQVSIIANNVANAECGSRAFARLTRAVERFLQADGGVQLSYLGVIPSDSALREAVMAQTPLVVRSPSSPAALSFGRLGERIDEGFFTYRVKGGMQFFFERLLEVSAHA